MKNLFLALTLATTFLLSLSPSSASAQITREVLCDTAEGRIWVKGTSLILPFMACRDAAGNCRDDHNGSPVYGSFGLECRKPQTFVPYCPCPTPYCPCPTQYGPSGASVAASNVDFSNPVYEYEVQCETKFGIVWVSGIGETPAIACSYATANCVANGGSPVFGGDPPSLACREREPFNPVSPAVYSTQACASSAAPSCCTVATPTCAPPKSQCCPAPKKRCKLFGRRK